MKSRLRYLVVLVAAGGGLAVALLLLIVVSRDPAPGTTCISFQTPFARNQRQFLQLEEIIGRFCENNPDVQVELLPDAPREQHIIIRRILSGKAPDIYEVPLAVLPGLASRSYVIDLGDTLAESVGEVFPSALDAGEYDNTPYASAFRARSIPLICTGSILLKAGYRPEDPLLSNWAELLVTCEPIKRSVADEGCHPMGIDGGDPDSLSRLGTMLVAQTEGELVTRKKDPTQGNAEAWRVAINSDAGTDALKMMAKLGKYVPRQAFRWSREDLLREFAEGRVAMFYGDAGDVSRIRSEAPDVPLYVFESPVDRAPGSWVDFHGAVITSTARHPDACKKLLAYLCDAEAQEMIMSGGTTGLPTFSPVRRKLRYSRWYRDNPRYRPFLKALTYPCATPIDGWPAVKEQVFGPELLNVLAGKTKPEAALEVIEERGNTVLSTYYEYVGHPRESTRLGMSVIAIGVFLLILFTVGHRAKNPVATGAGPAERTIE